MFIEPRTIKLYQEKYLNNEYEEILIITLMLSALSIKGENVSEIETYAFDQSVDKYFDLPVVREIKGGTKFIVTYEGDWTIDMKGAFGYACEIWKENMPTSLPINITAKIAKIRSSGGKIVLSSTRIQKLYNSRFIGAVNYQTHLYSQVKGVILSEYIRGANHQYIDSLTYDFFDKPDMTITYNSDCIDEFSFSLDATSVGDKYDFVTLALRDIAKGLGFNSAIVSNAAKTQLNITPKDLSPFEYLICNTIGTNAVQAFNNATQGSVNINIPSYGNVQLYAPTTWENNMSLNYFITDSTKNVTSLLSQEFGKGSVIRDITDDYHTIFRTAMGWYTLIATSANLNENIDISSTTDDVIAYNGNIVLGTPIEDLNILSSPGEYVLEDNMSINSISDDLSYINPAEICKPYDCSLDMSGNINSVEFTVALLKKDGTWDVVMELPITPMTINTENFTYHCDLEEYSRTADGYLRCRLNSFHRINSSGGAYKQNTTNYYLLENIPQKVEQEFIGVETTGNARSMMYDEYLRDIKIEIKNLEGTTRVVIEQLDKGERVPYRYDVPNFKDGYYIATVDKEFQSEFTVISYNENGTTRSETLLIEPLEPAMLNLSINMDGEYITIENNQSRNKSNDLIKSYEINTINVYNAYPVKSELNYQNKENKIDINDLERGMYVLTLIDVNGERHSFKFTKK